MCFPFSRELVSPQCQHTAGSLYPAFKEQQRLHKDYILPEAAEVFCNLYIYVCVFWGNNDKTETNFIQIIFIWTRNETQSLTEASRGIPGVKAGFVSSFFLISMVVSDFMAATRWKKYLSSISL